MRQIVVTWTVVTVIGLFCLGLMLENYGTGSVLEKIIFLSIPFAFWVFFALKRVVYSKKVKIEGDIFSVEYEFFLKRSTRKNMADCQGYFTYLYHVGRSRGALGAFRYRYGAILKFKDGSFIDVPSGYDPLPDTFFEKMNEWKIPDCNSENQKYPRLFIGWCAKSVARKAFMSCSITK